jgi:phosphoesterase RecJ-like protein
MATASQPANSPPAGDPVQAAVELLQRAERVAVVAHIGPDGDAIGSLLGIGAVLRRLGKAATLACDDGVPPLYQFLPGAGAVVRRPEGAFDLAVTVDCADFARGGAALAQIAVPERPLLNLDHHVTNTLFGTVNWVDPGANSTAEVVLALADALGLALDAEIATCLLTGLITDTQGFRTSSVNPRALRNAARLTEAGASAAQLAELTLNRRSLRSLCLWARALAEMRLEPDGLLWTHVTQAMRADCGIPEGGEANLTTFLLSAEEVCMSAVFIERRDGAVEMSFRAKPGYDVAVVAKQLGGGGHPPAAGSLIRGALPEVEARVLVELREALAAQKQALAAG